MSDTGPPMAWFFAEHGANHGPFTRDQMAEFVRSGRVLRDTLVSAQGTPGWLPLRDTPLGDLFQGESAPVPPPRYLPQRPRSFGRAAAPFPEDPGFVKQAAPAPSRSMGFLEAVASCFVNYARFQGRAPRSEYWYFQLFGLLAGLTSSGLDSVFYPGTPKTDFSPINGVTTLVLLLPYLSVTVRRLHDINRSGWNFWWIILPVVGWIVLLVFTVTRGTEGRNRYG